jgi:glutamate-1-semialdehyde aminotransferase
LFKKFKNNKKQLQDYARSIIPGLSGLHGKKPEMYLPGGNWPTYYSRAKGVNVWDLEGKKYLDFTMVGVGCCVLGYSDNDINEVAKKIIGYGSLTTLNPPEEIELAETLLEIHPWAEQVKFARTGGEMMAVAVRLARAATGRDKILFCGYHGWHDWYLSTNLTSNDKLNDHLLPGLKPLGVPKALRDTMIPFKFNNDEDIKNIVKPNAKNCAAIILEPARNTLASSKFLKEIRKIATENNCVLIFDEITSAWRNDTSGIHKELGVNPDMATFGKTMANGIPISALIGKKSVMEFSTKTFISSVNWTERLGPACALAFIEKHKKLKLGEILKEKGVRIRQIWQKAAQNANLKINIQGILPLSTFEIKNNQWPLIITFFIQEMLKRGILASDRCYSNLCHEENYLKIYEDACHEIFYQISKYLREEVLEEKLEGPIKQMGFSRLT